jgi:uncharacterized ion transporter superfamily protein YfcC
MNKKQLLFSCFFIDDDYIINKYYTARYGERILNNDQQQSKILQINKRAIVVAVVVILFLVVSAYILTFLLPRGAFERTAEGSIIAGTYHEDPTLEGIAWWQFLLAPFMILNPSEEGAMIIYSIMLLLLIIGAVFMALEKSGILVYMVKAISHKFRSKKYYLMAILSFAFMFLGSAVGMFEELIPLVPIIIMLSYAMGWDAFVGLGISVLGSCFGFAAGLMNPFTVGIAQTIGGLPMFSGIEVRVITFVIVYAILMAFLIPYAKKIDKYPQKSTVYKLDLERKKDFAFDIDDFKPDKIKGRALRWFAGWLGLIIVSAIVSIFWHALTDYIIYITLVSYVAGGFGASFICGIRGKQMLRLLFKGMLTLLPAVAMIMIAGGVRYIIDKGQIMDTILFRILPLLENQHPATGSLIIYLIIIVFNMFIPSGSAKAVLLMPIIYQLCSLSGIHPQVAVLAFAFGDGFSNVILPTNAGLLLILGMTTVDYGKWFRWSIKIQLSLLAATALILVFAQMVYYA